MKNKEIYVGFTFFIVGLLYFIYQFDSMYFLKIIKYWPIFILLAGLFMEFNVILGSSEKLIIILSGIFIVYGIMYILNIFYDFNHWSAHLAILSLSISAALLNIYIFNEKNDLILPFIFLLVVLSIFIFLFPIYAKYFPLIKIENMLPILLMIFGLLVSFKGFIKNS